jgi:homoaconitate hydratase
MTTEWGALTGWFPVDDVTRLGERAALRPVPRAHHERGRMAPHRRRRTRTRLRRAHHPRPRRTCQPFVAGPDTCRRPPVAELESGARPWIDKAYLLSCVNGAARGPRGGRAVCAASGSRTGVRFYVAAASARGAAGGERAAPGQTLLAAGATPLPPGCGPCIGLGEACSRTARSGSRRPTATSRGRMGSRDARCLPGEPARGRASALAGLHHGGVDDRSCPALRPRGPRAPAGRTSASRSCRASPSAARGRLLFVPKGQPQHRRHLRQGLHLPRADGEEMAAS